MGSHRLHSKQFIPVFLQSVSTPVYNTSWRIHTYRQHIKMGNDLAFQFKLIKNTQLVVFDQKLQLFAVFFKYMLEEQEGPGA